MKLTFVPEVCKPQTNEETGETVQPEYEGTVTLNMPTYDERLAFLEEIEATAIDFKEPVTEEEKAEKAAHDNRKRVARLRQAAKKAKAHFVSADIKRKSDGFVFDSWEKLDYDSDMISVIRECGNKIIGKFKVNDPS